MYRARSPSVSGWASVRSVCCPRPANILGPYVTLLWSSWYRIRMVRCISGKYWWPTLAKDVRVYVNSCPVCAQCKAPSHLPRGKLQPLPVPQRPLSHLLVDFLTDLPPSQDNTTILVVVDRFSKSCNRLPLPGLPTALLTAEALYTNVFRHYSVPEDIVADRGPQFTS